MKRLLLKAKRLLRNEDGSALADGMLGIIVVAIAIGGLSGIASASAQAVYGSIESQQRAGFLRNHVSELASDPSSVPNTPQTSNVNIAGVETAVTTWSSTDGKTTSLHAAAPSSQRHDETVSCTNPASLPKQCLAVQLPVTAQEAGIQITELPFIAADPAATPGTAGSFTSPVDGEVRYVFKLSGVAGVGEVTFDTPAGRIETIWIDETTNGFSYGSLTVPAGTPITVSVQGTTATFSNFTVYEAPR